MRRMLENIAYWLGVVLIGVLTYLMLHGAILYFSVANDAAKLVSNG